MKNLLISIIDEQLWYRDNSQKKKYCNDFDKCHLFIQKCSIKTTKDHKPCVCVCVCVCVSIRKF